MRVPMRAALVLATTATLAACGNLAASMASAPQARPSDIAQASAGRLPPAGSRAEAVALARMLLSRLRLPAGARRLPPTPVPPSVSEPSLWAGAAAALDLQRLFELRQPMEAAAALLTAHVPVGMDLAVTGQTGGPAGVTSQDVAYGARHVPAGVYAAQLVLTVAPARSGGGSLVRADAQVIWYPSRTAAEYIDPARYHVLTVAVTLFNPRLHTIHRVVTAKAAITRLAEALNQSPVEPTKIANCPAIFANYRLAFAVSRQSRPVVVVSATRWPCLGAQIRVRGRTQPPLQEEGTVVAIADRLLGVTPRP